MKNFIKFVLISSLCLVSFSFIANAEINSDDKPKHTLKIKYIGWNNSQGEPFEYCHEGDYLLSEGEEFKLPPHGEIVNGKKVSNIYLFVPDKYAYDDEGDDIIHDFFVKAESHKMPKYDLKINILFKEI